jgi:hypothetical protein
MKGRAVVDRRERVRGLLQRKTDGTGVISVRVPTALKAKLDKLRKCANLAGFNFNATLAEVLNRAANEIDEELGREEPKIRGGATSGKIPLAVHKAGRNGGGAG